MTSQLVAASHAAFWGLLACASPAELARVDANGRALATLAHYGDPVRVETPRSVDRGEAFRVAVTAYGGGCVRKGETETKVEGAVALITAYEYDVTAKLPPNGACIAVLRLDVHEATIQFDARGAAVIIVRGQRKPSRETITVRRTVAVK